METDLSPSFLHLRASVVTDVAMPPQQISALEGDPLAAERTYYLFDETLGYGAGTSRLGRRDEEVILAHTEFTVISDGELTLLQSDGTSVDLKAGDCAIIPAGLRARWKQQGDVSRTFMVFPGLRGGSPSAIIKIDPQSDLSPSNGPARDLLLTSPPPTARSRVWFEDTSRNLRIGVWECTPYSRRYTRPAYCELMHVLSGSVTFTQKSGRSWTVRAGETIIVPSGAENAWASDVTIRKVFCIVS